MATDCGLMSAGSNRVIVRHQREDVQCFGNLFTNQADRITRVVRATNIDFEVDKKTKTSEEIRADRQVSGIYATGASTKGKIDYEFSPGVIDDYLAAYLGTAWTNELGFFTERGSHVAVTGATEVVLTGKDVTNMYPDGSKIKLEGFTDVTNNTYATVTTAVYAGGNTTLTLSGVALTAEAGSAYTTIYDADDVIVQGTTITSTAAGFAGNFTTARAAGMLEVGRAVYIQGLGLEEGEVSLTGLPAEDDGVSINGTRFEFTLTGIVATGSVAVTIGADAAATAANLQAAIMGKLNDGTFQCSASVSGGDVTIRNLDREGGGAIVLDAALTNGTVTDFSGGDSSTSGVFTIVSCSDALLEVSPAPGVDANAGGKTVTIKGSHLSPPSIPGDITAQSFQFETDFSDVNQVLLYKGMRVEGISIDASAEDLVTGSVDLMGTSVTSYATTQLGNTANQTVYEALTTPVFNATSDVKRIGKNGATLDTVILSLNLELKTSLRQQAAVGSYYPKGIGQGRLDITGKLEAYFETLDFFLNFLNNTYISISYTFEDIDHNSYHIYLPKVFLMKDKLNIGGIDSDVVEEIEFGAVFDPNSKAEIVISRFSSTRPTTD